MSPANGTKVHPPGSRSPEWFTPPWIFGELGLDFDLDPATPPGDPLPWIPAVATYTSEDDGLVQPWFGRVWLNPPYGNETGQWLKKMVEHARGVALVFSRTDTTWFHESVLKADAILFLSSRVQFVDRKGRSHGSPGCGSLLAAWGRECALALQAMADRGLGVFWDRRPAAEALPPPPQNSRSPLDHPLPHVLPPWPTSDDLVWHLADKHHMSFDEIIDLRGLLEKHLFAPGNRIAVLAEALEAAGVLAKVDLLGDFDAGLTMLKERLKLHYQAP